jgi:ABC-type uncharacterized transport system substrate-binding protein
MRRAAAANALRRFAVTAFLCLALVFAAYAHPHVFITSRVAVDFEGGAVSRISVEWSFDELFSQMIISDYDQGKKGSFTDGEAAALKKGAFDNLRNFHYFLALGVDGKSLALPPIRDFKPSIREGKLVYSFSLPLSISVPLAGRELRLTIYDDTYYVAFDKMSPEDVAIEGDGSVTASVSIVKAKIKAEWPGQFMPDQILLRLKQG